MLKEKKIRRQHMKRLLIIITIFGLGLGLWAGDMSHEKHLVFKHYVAAQEALAADDFKLAKSSLELLAKNSQGELKKLTESVLKAGDLTALREAFKPLSESIAKAELAGGLALAYCPMAKAHWVQKNGKVANPYYGSSMLRCGTIKKVAGEDKHHMHHKH
jgi:hypothetical protein